MAEDALAKALKKRRQITISIIGRRTGRTISLPVWFVFDRDTLWLLPVHGSNTHWYRSVGQIIERFRDKYTPDVIARLYPGPLNVAVKVSTRVTTNAPVDF